MERLEKRWWGIKLPNEAFEFEQFGFSQTVLAFVILLAGVFISCVALMSELMYRRLKQKKVVSKKFLWRQKQKKVMYEVS